ncbi:MAG: AI-2E family transporter [Candidatus Peregrinibacteria bacterium]
MNTYRNFFNRYQKKLDELKTKLQTIRKQEEVLENQVPLHETKAKPQEVKIILSIDSIFKATLAVLGAFALVYVLGYIKSTIIIFLVALFLAAAFNPGVDRLQGYRIPRWLGILLLYVVVLGIIILLFTSLVPIIAEQIGALAISVRDMVQNLMNGTSAPDSWLVAKIRPLLQQVWVNVDQAELVNTLSNSLREIASRLTSFAGNALGAIFAIFNGILNLILVLIITFFMVVNNKHTSHFFYSLFPRKFSGYLSVKAGEISIRIGEWIRGQVVLGLSMGVLTFIIFSTIGLNYALTLALVSAIGEFIPYLGPLITFLAAALIAMNQDPMMVLWLIPAYAVIQFIESNIMAPLILGRSVGLNPIIIMFALLTGGTLGYKVGDNSYGLALVGMILSVPIANIISIFVEDYAEKNK